MTTTTKTPWADTPFPLLKIPGSPGAPTCSNAGVLGVCIEMANVHNLLLRGLNSIYNQAPFVTLPADISDLMLYTTAWADTIHHHHSAEETLFFPRIEALAKAAGQDCNMAGNVAQHQGFEAGMAEMVRWAKRVGSGEVKYDAEVLKGLIDAFAPLLTQHLHEEIDTLVELEKCDEEGVRKAMKVTADEGARTADPVCICISLLLHLTSRGFTADISGCVVRTSSYRWSWDVWIRIILAVLAFLPYRSLCLG